ncbi:hypothetical protein DDV93_07090 [Cereibacter johrii]|nr:hypothetical protein DDV93_07090 [Cereibacter johrii]
MGVGGAVRSVASLFEELRPGSTRAVAFGLCAPRIARIFRTMSMVRASVSPLSAGRVPVRKVEGHCGGGLAASARWQMRRAGLRSAMRR